MPETLRLPDGSYMRRIDIQSVIRYIYSLQCVEIVGFSNIGKSAFMRLLAQTDVWTQELGEAAQGFLPVYIDCNRMLGMTDQGFYELILRCLQESYAQMTAVSQLAEAYDGLIRPTSGFQVPLSFNQGLTAVLNDTPQRLILLFDEFDEPFAQIDSRVFLNLRALRDRYPEKLIYLTATSRSQEIICQDEHRSEFSELFRHRTWHLAPLTRSDSERLIRRYADAYEADFIAADFDFICEWGGGHPNLMEGVCRSLDAAITASGQGLGDVMMRQQLHREVARELHDNGILQAECRKIWRQISREEQEELRKLFTGDESPEAAGLERLIRNHLLLPREGRYQIFSRLLSDYIQRLALQPLVDGGALWVDVDSGEVYVGGMETETLTNLEYKLMLLLFQSTGKIVDKYEIVSNVWGESYIDEVDDARIEKLVSRLRQKIEADSGNPRFLVTVRGRGYRLQLE
ncbi:MAG: winged helix-turn-helix transcriptional regulator [Caldilineaceae bacterium]|nr:winged helix-turn-helix transcriptional regulator [Caldilineaceae bacterium]